jgi:hypothetical protein
MMFVLSCLIWAAVWFIVGTAFELVIAKHRREQNHYFEVHAGNGTRPDYFTGHRSRAAEPQTPKHCVECRGDCALSSYGVSVLRPLRIRDMVGGRCRGFGRRHLHDAPSLRSAGEVNPARWLFI